MDPKRALDDLNSVLGALRRQQFVTVLSLLLVLVLGVIATTKKERTVLEPPVRTKRITITGDQVDAAWLEEMGGYTAHLMLDASPSSVDYQQAQVLRYAHPSTYGVLQQQMAVQARRLKDSNASTVFWLQQAAPDPERNRVVLIGQLDTYVNGQLVPGSSRTVSYLAGFQLKFGQTLLADWKEVPADDIWLAHAAEKTAAAEKAAKEAARAAAAKDKAHQETP